MKEHALAIVFLGLLFMMFKSPFPNRLLNTEADMEEAIQFPQDIEFEYMPFETETTNKDSLILSPGATAFIEKQ